MYLALSIALLVAGASVRAASTTELCQTFYTSTRGPVFTVTQTTTITGHPQVVVTTTPGTTITPPAVTSTSSSSLRHRPWQVIANPTPNTATGTTTITPSTTKPVVTDTFTSTVTNTNTISASGKSSRDFSSVANNCHSHPDGSHVDHNNVHQFSHSIHIYGHCSSRIYLSHSSRHANEKSPRSVFGTRRHRQTP
jgi:hypothetical protein